MDMRKHSHGAQIVGHIVGGIALAVVLGFLFGIVVMWLWNALLPGLFGLKFITYWQAVGLIILSRLLFGSFGHGKGGGPFRGGGRWGKRGNFKGWWQAEGEQAFDAYVARKAAGE